MDGDKTVSKFGNKFKVLRTRYGMTQNDIAKHLGISQQTVASWESNRTEPNIATIKLIAEYFNISVNYFFGEDNDSGDATQSPEFFIIQRNAKQMSKTQLNKMYNLLKLSFDEFDWEIKSKN